MTERPFAQNHGAGYRAVYDLAEPERSVFVISTGQSGNPLSSYYEDYAEPWRDGRYLPMLTDRSRAWRRTRWGRWCYSRGEGPYRPGGGLPSTEEAERAAYAIAHGRAFSHYGPQDHLNWARSVTRTY